MMINRKKITALLIILIYSTSKSLYSFKNSDEILEDIKKYHAATPINKKLKERLSELTTLDKNIIFLESKIPSCSISSVTNLAPLANILIIHTRQPDNSPTSINNIVFDVCHETERLKTKTYTVLNPYENMEFSNVIAAGLYACVLQKHSGIWRPTTQLLKIASLFGSTFCATEFLKRSIEKENKRKADTITYQQLLDHGQYSVAFTQIAKFFAYHEAFMNYYEAHHFKKFLYHHEYLNRALNGIQLIEKAGYNIHELLLESSPEFQEYVNKQFKKYLPPVAASEINKKT